MKLRPQNKKSDIDYDSMTAPYSNNEGDVAHEVIFLLRLIMNQKIKILKLNHFPCSILEKKVL